MASITATCEFNGNLSWASQLPPAAGGGLSDNVAEIKSQLMSFLNEYLAVNSDKAAEEDVDLMEEVVSDDEQAQASLTARPLVQQRQQQQAVAASSRHGTR